MIRLCDINELENNSTLGVELHGMSYIVVHKNEQFYVFENNCPHRSIGLEWMPNQFFDADKNFLQCSTHGALFKPDTGECVFGPCVGDKLTKLSTKVEAGALWIIQ